MLPALVYQDFPSVDEPNKGATDIMPQNENNGLILSLIDCIDRLDDLHQFLYMAVEETANPHNRTIDRISLLLDAYLANSEKYRDEIKDSAERLRKLSDSK